MSFHLNRITGEGKISFLDLQRRDENEIKECLDRRGWGCKRYRILDMRTNSGECWPGKKFIKLPGRVHVIIGNPVKTKNKDTKKLVCEIRQWTQQQLNQIHTDNP